MMVSYKQLRGFTAKTKEGAAGRVKDFYFDDRDWRIRYLVEDNGSRARRPVLVNREWISEADPAGMELQLLLTRQQLSFQQRIGPTPVLAKDIPKQPAAEMSWALLSQQLYPASVPDLIFDEARTAMPAPWLTTPESAPEKPAPESNLQSAFDVIGYRVSTNDGKLGYVEDFIIDSKDWTVSFLVINVSRGLDGRRILVATDWVDWVSWRQRKISISADRETLRACPTFMLDIPLNPEDEPLLNGTFECKQYQERISA